MKKIYSIVYLFLILPILIGSNARAQSAEAQDVLTAAVAGINHFLEKIPQGEESFYGFQGRDEFSKVQPGNPYRIYTLNNEFYSTNNIENKNYITPTDQWIVPLKVNEKYRVLLTIAKMDGAWKAVNFGAAMLATELYEFENKHPLNNKNGMLLNVFEPLCDLVLYLNDENNSVLKAYPVSSASQ